MTDIEHADTDNFEGIFTNKMPLLDVRAPIEFKQGAFPTAVNYPLMDDEQRKKVGICYKNYGKDAAIKLGNKLVSGEQRACKISDWLEHIEKNPLGYIYCFRGGLRSRTVQQWLAAEGIQYPLVKGGYKAMRNYLIQTLDELSESFNFIIIGGRTGTRKTDLITVSENAVDLEGRANHRGSSFGRRVGGQPTVINFENQIAIDLLKLKSRYSTVFLEDEGVTIGSCSVPAPLRKQIKSSPLYLVEATIDERVENILSDYVLTLSDEYIMADQTQGWQTYRHAMFASLDRIKKRLGGERHCRLLKMMEIAFKTQSSFADSDLHRDWIKVLLSEYYDPMYDFQIEKKQLRVQEVASWDIISRKMGLLR